MHYSLQPQAFNVHLRRRLARPIDRSAKRAVNDFDLHRAASTKIETVYSTVEIGATGGSDRLST